MNFDITYIPIIAAVAFFYVKLVYVQRRRARSEATKTNIEIAKARKKGKTPIIPEKPAFERFSAQFVSLYLAFGLVVLVLIGFVWKGNPFNLSSEIVSLYWVPIVVGFVGLGLDIK